MKNSFKNECSLTCDYQLFGVNESVKETPSAEHLMSITNDMETCLTAIFSVNVVK